MVLPFGEASLGCVSGCDSVVVRKGSSDGSDLGLELGSVDGVVGQLVSWSGEGLTRL